jgi:hypothetical protein
MPADLLAWTFLVGLLAYGLLGGLVARYLWPANQRPNPHADPATYAAYWFPRLTAVLAYGWVELVLSCASSSLHPFRRVLTPAIF